MTKNKSKKRSASNNAAQPDNPILFIDRCAWSGRLGEALAAQGIPYIAHQDRFDQACPDEEWLAVAGRERWVVLTRDKRIRYRPAELRAFREHKVVGFVLASSEATGAQTAQLVLALYDKMMRKARGAKPPALFTVTLAGGIHPVKL